MTININTTALRDNMEQEPAIIFADDIAEFLTSLSNQVSYHLSSLNLSHWTAADGEEAIEVYNALVEAGTPVAAVVFDQVMPKKTGIEAYEEIVRTSENPPGAILLSGQVDRQDNREQTLLRAADAGMLYYVRKSDFTTDPKALYGPLEEVLGRFFGNLAAEHTLEERMCPFRLAYNLSTGGVRRTEYTDPGNWQVCTASNLIERSSGEPCQWWDAGENVISDGRVGMNLHRCNLPPGGQLPSLAKQTAASRLEAYRRQIKGE